MDRLPNGHLDQNYSEFCGPVCKKAKEVAAKIKEAAEKAIRDAKAAKAKADQLAKDAIAKGTQAAKDAAAKAKADAAKLIKAAKDANAKIKKGIKGLVGKALAGARKLLRKAILKKFATAIRLNVHGIATRLLPSIISASDAKSKKFKGTIIPKSKATYADVLKEWLSLGGKKEGLDAAILHGAKVKFHKFSNASGDESVNNISEEGTPDYSAEPIPADEIADIEDQGGDTEVDPEEKAKGFKALWIKIMSLFKKHGSDENPYEDGSSEAGDVPPIPSDEDMAEYEDSVPLLDEMGNPVLDAAGNIVYVNKGSSRSIFAKPLFWVSILGLAGIVTAVVIYKRNN
jgi:hypothetical protein